MHSKAHNKRGHSMLRKFNLRYKVNPRLYITGPANKCTHGLFYQLAKNAREIRQKEFIELVKLAKTPALKLLAEKTNDYYLARLIELADNTNPLVLAQLSELARFPEIIELANQSKNEALLELIKCATDYENQIEKI